MMIGEDASDCLGDEGCLLALGRGDGREHLIEKAGYGHIPEWEDSKLVGPWNERGCGTSGTTGHNRLCTIYQAHILCAQNKSVENGHTWQG